VVSNEGVPWMGSPGGYPLKGNPIRVPRGALPSDFLLRTIQSISTTCSVTFSFQDTSHCQMAQAINDQSMGAS
jgi:hypothetical protein